MFRGRFLQGTLRPGIPPAWLLESSLGSSVSRQWMQLLLSLLNQFEGSTNSTQPATQTITDKALPSTAPTSNDTRTHIKHRHIDIYRHVESRVPFLFVS